MKPRSTPALPRPAQRLHFWARPMVALGRCGTILPETALTLGGHQCSRTSSTSRKRVSFTTTLHDPTFLRLVLDFTGNVPGEGGLITFPDSNWLASVVIPHQPHFPGQPEHVNVLWGYGLAVDKPGKLFKKPMSACTGHEIMTKILGNLRIERDASKILDAATCMPCMTPFITSQFLRRESGNRPQVIPEGSKNLAFTGQFCKLHDDVVFTVEYSIRSAQTAVYSRLKLDREPPVVYKGKLDPRVLLMAFWAQRDVRP